MGSWFLSVFDVGMLKRHVASRKIGGLVCAAFIVEVAMVCWQAC